MDAVASVAVTINAPPLGGGFLVAPPNGTELVTKFSFLAAQWYDADLPLQYQFSYIATSGTEVTLCSKAETAFGSATLPAGLQVLNYSVSCVARVYDSYSAASFATHSVTVHKQAVARDAAAISQLVTATLTQGSSTIDGLKQATAIGNYLLNQVDCSHAPNCASLNRNNCYRTKNTCGACLTTGIYIGDIGDSNKPCVRVGSSVAASAKSTSGNRRRLDDTDAREVPCTTAANCTAFQVCQGGFCISEPKLCPNNCTYPQGSCRFVNADSGAAVSSCYVGASDCNAVCSCLPEYTGSASCALNSTQLLQKQALRHQVVGAIQQLVALEDADQQSVEGWINTLVQASQVPEELSEDASRAILTTVNTVIANAATVGLSTDVLINVLQSVDSILQGSSLSSIAARRRLASSATTAESNSSAAVANSTLHHAVQTLALYRNMVSDTLLPGQDAVQLVLPQFRVSVQKHTLQSAATTDSANSTSTITMNAPQSELESYNVQGNYSFSVPIDAAAAAANNQTFLSLSLTTMRSALFNAQLGLQGTHQMYSNPLTVELSNVVCSSSSARGSSNCEYQMVLQTSASLPAIAASLHTVEEEHNTTCANDDYSQHTYNCSDRTHLIVACNGTNAVLTSKCPVTHYSAMCSGVSSHLQVNATSCRVVDYTNSSITCACPFAVQTSSAPSSRRLLHVQEDPISFQHSGSGSSSDDDSTSNAGANANAHQTVSYVAMLTAVEDNFVTTVESAEGLNANTVKKGWSVIVTVGSFALAIAFALHWSHRADSEMNKVKPDMKEKDRKLVKQSHFKSGGGELMERLSNWLARDTNVHKAKISAGSANYSINKDVHIAEQALPMILSSNSLSHRVREELKHHHKWFGIVFFYSKSFPRVLRVISLATNVTAMLFMQSLTYALTNPDDGTCEMQHTKSTCLALKSPYATGEPKCAWNNVTDECAFVQPDGSMKVILFVAIFSALISTPLALVVDWIIVRILSAETKHSGANALTAVAPAPINAANGATAVVAAGSNKINGRSRPIYNNQLQNLTSIAPTGAGTATAATNTPAPRNQRDLVSASVYGSMFGSVLGWNYSNSNSNENSQSVTLNAQSDLRRLITQITAYRSTLTAEQKVEFDGK